MTDSNEQKQPLVSHFRELGYRIKMIFIWVLIGFGVAYYFKDEVMNWLVAPLAPAMKGRPGLHFFSPVEPFFAYLKMSLKVGVFFSLPAVFYHIWAFLAPGLKKKEKKVLVGIAFFSFFFFSAGVLFAYYLVFPYGFKFLISFAESSPGSLRLLSVLNDIFKDVYQVNAQLVASSVKVSLTPTIMMGDYLKLIINLLLAFGIVFEMPILIFFLVVNELVTPRGLFKFFKYFVVLSFGISAFLTPPDIITQIMMAVPLISMYIASTLVAWLVLHRRQKRD
ncbi:MAG: twin-arginine translocase subunit TatC [Deltaproteobacteria bacterium]|jgi:sec-independent protein translocase protein TatC|nr:twin-arginine translocase subunit TatC [Deltaproteobacteria bacterium]